MTQIGNELRASKCNLCHAVMNDDVMQRVKHINYAREHEEI